MICLCTGKCQQTCPKCNKQQGCTSGCQCSPVAYQLDDDVRRYLIKEKESLDEVKLENNNVRN